MPGTLYIDNIEGSVEDTCFYYSDCSLPVHELLYYMIIFFPGVGRAPTVVHQKEE